MRRCGSVNPESDVVMSDAVCDAIATIKCQNLLSEMSLDNLQATTAPVQLDALLPLLEQGYVVLTPGLRLARLLISGWSQHRFAQGVELLPEAPIYPVDAWLESCWCSAVEQGLLTPRKLLNRVEERQLWQRIIEADLGKAADFTLLQPRGAAERALQARAQWLMGGGDSSDNRQRSLLGLDLDCSAFDVWLAQFEAALDHNEWTTRADSYKALLSVDTDAIAQLNPDVGKLALAHVLTLPVLTQRAVEHLNGGSVLWVPSPSSWTESSQACSGDHPAGKPPWPAHRYGDKRQEFSAAATWAAERYRAGCHNTAIVLMDMKGDRAEIEYHLRREFDCLDARYDRLPVNFSTGMPLADVPLYRDALLVLSLGGHDGNAPIAREDALALLRSPYLAGLGNGADTDSGNQAWLRLLKAITQLASAVVDMGDLTHLATVHAPHAAVTDALQQIRQQPMRAACRGSRSPSQWLEVLRARLKVWRWPARSSLDSLEYQQIERFESSLDALAGLDEVVGPVSYGQVVALWRAILDDTVFQPKTDTQVVQVLGAQEAVGLSFDALWVCGLQSGVLPESPRLLPFLPGKLQRMLQLPQLDADRLLQYATDLICSWHQTHRHVVLSCHSQQEGVTSPHSLLIQPIDQPTAPGSHRHWLSAEPCEWIDEGPTPVATTAGELVGFGGGAAVLANQSNCPFRAWIIHHLGPEAVEPARRGLSAAEQGSLIHDALYALWGELRDSDILQATDITARRTLVQRVVDHAVQRLEDRAVQRHCSVRKRVGSGCLTLEANRIEQLLLAWLDKETERSEAFTVLEREQDHHLAIGPLTLSMRPDRIDVLSDGRQVVVDYKTGVVSRSSWLGDRPKDPQLPLYALMNAAVTGIAFARVQQQDPSFVPLGDDLGLSQKDTTVQAQLARTKNRDADTWEALLAHWQVRLTTLANDFVAGEAAIDPLPQACNYCTLASVCRIHEGATPTSEGLVPSEDLH